MGESAVTYLCGEVFNHLRLIRQSLLLQGKRTMSWGFWGTMIPRWSHPGAGGKVTFGFLPPPSFGDYRRA